MVLCSSAVHLPQIRTYPVLPASPCLVGGSKARKAQVLKPRNSWAGGRKALKQRSTKSRKDLLRRQASGAWSAPEGSDNGSLSRSLAHARCVRSFFFSLSLSLSLSFSVSFLSLCFFLSVIQPNMYAYLHIRTHDIYIYIYIYMFVYVHKYACMHMHMRLYVYMWASVCVLIYIYIDRNICYIFAYAYAHVHYCYMGQEGWLLFRISALGASGFGAFQVCFLSPTSSA